MGKNKHAVEMKRLLQKRKFCNSRFYIHCAAFFLQFCVELRKIRLELHPSHYDTHFPCSRDHVSAAHEPSLSPSGHW